MKNKLFYTYICILLLFSILFFSTGKTTAAISADSETKKYIITLNSNGGTLINYNKSRDIPFQPGEPLKLPKARKKGYVFCGWTIVPFSNIAWFTITGVNTNNPHNSTYFWHESKNLFAQYAKVTMKKLGKKKLKVSLSKWQDARWLDIQYSTNKKFKDAKSIFIQYSEGRVIGPIDKKNCSLKYDRNKKTLSLTLSKLKTKKRYYFRFQYFNRLEELQWENDRLQSEILSIGDWFQKSVKM